MLVAASRALARRAVAPGIHHVRYMTSSTSKVMELKSDGEYQQAVKDVAASNSAAIVDFTAKWCGPCKMIAPVYEQLAQDFPSVRFYKVDIDAPELAATVVDNSVSAVPTFVGIRGSQGRVAAFSGADRAQLQRLVLELIGASQAG